MGALVEGKWLTQDQEKMNKPSGQFVRKASSFRHWITADGQAGSSGQGGFKAEAGRYHLYVAKACPWAHRTLILRAIKGLEDMISISVVNPYMGEQGWSFEPGLGVIEDTVNQVSYVHQLYSLADSKYSGRASVPILWDKHQQTIVNNESSDIIRIFNSAFDHLGAKSGDFYPQSLRDDINEINELVYHGVNNGVYKAGFATTQAAYEEAVTALFKVLDQLEQRLSQQPYLVGDQLTEADWRLFTTLVRFDAVYVGHFKCNQKRIVDYPALSNYLNQLYQYPGIGETVDLESIKQHYYRSHIQINPSQIVPLGPLLDFG